ncbi:allantoate amidohydrolase [Azospirillum rugosum]|uniref:Allantoate deiminase n=1 Tax=Azospirillum rugosum TaxID=416170 RepID=A0ABS4SSL2_9PROT|nr:allantoate amidohydrolase [Azospirillum rugosum]MBP2295548.1 allantoate deiminase [Azospirillum rugosum]MDQ0528427.1 allantoate deiminase [Azospirillum rugosum]
MTDLGTPLMARLEELAAFSQDEGALTRLFLTPQHKAAADQVTAWMKDAGMAVHLDPIGTVVGRYEGAAPGAPALLLGSHIDTVRNAGKYDGNLGVLAAIAAVAELNRLGERLPFAIEVLAFGDEEGVRFPHTLTGSRAIVGRFDPDALDGRDRDGVRMADALRAFGGDPDAIASVARKPGEALAFVELHIEQGPVLEAEGLPVGIVTAINGASRFSVRLRGMAGHAGTVPMGHRRDALVAAAEMVLAVERIASSIANLVATVGRIEAKPGAVNVIPGEVVFTMDVRAPEDFVRDAACTAIRTELEGIAARRGVAMTIEGTHNDAAAVCSPAIMERIEAAVRRAGIRPHHLPSGAGHDAMSFAGSFAGALPMGMLFVRCKGGISHNPAESITVEDADLSVRILLDLLRHFDHETLSA